MSLLRRANEKLKIEDYKGALDLYIQVLSENPSLEQFIQFNLDLCVANLSGESLIAYKKLMIHKKSLTTLNQDVAVHVEKNEPTLGYSKNYEGRLEEFRNNQLTGWAVSRNHPNEIFELGVYVDNILFLKINNDVSRRDLLRHGKSTGKGGYSLFIPKKLLVEPTHTITINFPDGQLLASLQVKGTEIINNYDAVRIAIPEKVSIIVPIYNAVEDLRVCIERLRKYTKKDVDIILINDASTDSAILDVLKQINNIDNFRVFHNEKNLGFTKTVNKGIKLAGENDVVLLNSDARVTSRWLEGLRYALSIDATIATVTPMSDRAGAFSAPSIGNENALPPNIDENDYAVSFRRRSIGMYPTVPTGNGFCMYIRRACINQIGLLDEVAFSKGYGEENDFCMRARANGWRHVIDDRTYVFHDRSKSFGDQKADLIKAGREIVDKRYPDYKKAISVFTDSPLINLARFKAKQALNDCLEKKPLARGLFVISTLTGGTPQTNRDLMLALTENLEPWLLHCDSRVISLYKIRQNSEDELIARHILEEPVEPLTHFNSEYDRVVAKWLATYDFEFVHIRHLLWHSLSLPRLAKVSGARVFNSFHDYYTICPTIKLLDENNKFCDGACTKTDGDCKPELWAIDAFPKLKDNWVHNWRKRFSSALQYCDVFVTTHQSVKDTILKGLDIPSENFHVIPHGRDFNAFHQLAESYRQGDTLKILVPGNISEPKGSQIIIDLLKRDKKEKLHFHVLGNSNIKFEHPRLTFHGKYEREDFAEHVKKINPHVGAVLSIWNETWCHTLTELWSVGLPVIVTDFPTLAQRVKSTGAGWVLKNVPLEIEDLLNKDFTADHLSKANQVFVWQNNEGYTLNNNQMAKDYLGLYMKL